MTLASSQGLHALPWTSTSPNPHVARAAMGLTTGQVEAGHGCPMTMTFAAVPALRATPELAAEWEPLLTAAGYDGELKPISEKTSAKCGMAMTEKQGGSDVRANSTYAEADRRRRVRDHRPQVVLQRADVRPVPRPRPGRRGRHVLRRAAHPRPTARATSSASSA